MHNRYVPKLSLEATHNPFKNFSADMTGHIQKTGAVEGPSFQNIIADTLNQVNHTVQKPDALLHQSMTTGNVDIHEVMIANAKAELAVNITAQFTTKIVQAYDKILQIQV